VAGDDHGGIGIRIEAQEARASVEGVRKVACSLFLFPLEEIRKIA
jgi:hypothetical protein